MERRTNLRPATPFISRAMFRTESKPSGTRASSILSARRARNTWLSTKRIVSACKRRSWKLAILRKKKVAFQPIQVLASPTKPKQNMLHIIWSIIIGFIVGWIARAIMPGVQHLGFIATTLLGIGGSIL